MEQFWQSRAQGSVSVVAGGNREVEVGARWKLWEPRGDSSLGMEVEEERGVRRDFVRERADFNDIFLLFVKELGIRGGRSNEVMELPASKRAQV